MNHSASGRTDASGNFALEGLVAGTYWLELRQWETGLSHGESVDVAASREIVLDVPSARIVGSVVDATDRRPVAGARKAVAFAPISQRGRGGAMSLQDLGEDLYGGLDVCTRPHDR